MLRLLTVTMSLFAARQALSIHPLTRFARGAFARQRATLPFSTKSAVEWPVDRVRSQFINYFVDQQHTNYKSSPCVPVNDPTLLFANAGMNQFKAIFTGTIDPNVPMASLVRAVNSQKCIRAGGKHNDLEDVGKDTYHHTFFEMLGTWSFSNYFKKEAIDWAYDILVNQYRLDPNRLYASYFGGDAALGLPCDDEARNYWLKYLPADRVLPFDKKANFWEMGDTGPCGPCSEIHYDRIGGRDASALVNADDPDVIEIWNLVFIQFNREPSGELRPLPNKHIDTGMGLERLTSILQNKRSNYDTDVFQGLFAAIHNAVGGAPYAGLVGDADARQNYRDTAYRVIADHVRTLTFAIADGAVPSNEGRGYVLRRVLRRAVRYGMQTLHAPQGFFAHLVPVLVQQMATAYPELADKQDEVVRVVREEEAAFSTLLQRGVKYFNELLAELRAAGQTVVSGDKAFLMYDSLGFPIDLTQIMAAEAGVTVDLEGFHAAMREQQERGRLATRQKRLGDRTELALGAEQTAYLKDHGVLPTDDSAKYDWDAPLRTTVKALYTSDGFVDTVDGTLDTVGVVLEATSFYAEAGGQAADTGRIVIAKQDGSVAMLDVLDVQVFGGYVLHTCAARGPAQSLAGLTTGAAAVAEVNYDLRRRVAPNHTMTHVLNFALREVLGEGIVQKGSSVTHERLRFDFSLNRAISKEELAQIEQRVNEVISAKHVVRSEALPLQQAMSIQGLRAVFGEAYPDPVRVVSLHPEGASSDVVDGLAHSVEFCGGTHIANTQEAIAFVIIEETSIAKGVRRITGLTGLPALEARTAAAAMRSALSELEARRVANQSLLPVEEQIAALRHRLESATISVADRVDLSARLEALHKAAFAEKKQIAANSIEQTLQEVRKTALEYVAAGRAVGVLTVPVGSDARAIKKITEEIKSVAPDLSFLGVSAEGGKVTVFCHCTAAAQAAGLQANTWVSSVLSVAGGRGGGKPGSAQGSVLLPDSADVDGVVKTLSNAAEAEAARRS